MKEAAALGFRAHSGWAVVVAVAGSPRNPVVLDRRRIVIADAAIPGSKQPFHAAERLEIRDAEELISRCRESAEKLAAAAIAQLRQEHHLVGSGLLIGSGRALPGLESILRSHALIHTAEGEFFREVLAGTSEQRGLPVKRFKEREVWDHAAEVWKVNSETLQARITALGRSLGPPWTQDEKLATLAACLVLGGAGGSPAP